MSCIFTTNQFSVTPGVVAELSKVLFIVPNRVCVDNCLDPSVCYFVVHGDKGVLVEVNVSDNEGARKILRTTTNVNFAVAPSDFNFLVDFWS